MVVEGFDDPWEQTRLLSDRARNGALIELLRRRAPGARVLEVGAAAGLFACVAARLGARKVLAVEASELASVAAEMVYVNGLGHVVEVVQADLADLEPREVDLAFGELLNAEPFAEGVVETMRAASRWVADGGLLAPSRLRVRAALVASEDAAEERRRARAALLEIAGAQGLRTGPCEEVLASPASDRYLVPSVTPVSTDALVADVDLRSANPPGERFEVEVTPTAAGRAGGVVIWFEAPLVDELELSNRPGEPGHWGHLVLGWPEAVEVREGHALRLGVSWEDELVEVRPLE